MNTRHDNPELVNAGLGVARGVTLAAFLADRDEACPSCGYNVRGLAGNRCPECNTELVLRIAVAEPRMGLYLSALIAWALGAGFSVLLLVYLLMVTVFAHRGLPPMREFAPVPCSGAFFEGGAVVLLMIYQRRVRRLASAWRVMILVLGVGATLLNVGLFAAFVN